MKRHLSALLYETQGAVPAVKDTAFERSVTTWASSMCTIQLTMTTEHDHMGTIEVLMCHFRRLRKLLRQLRTKGQKLWQKHRQVLQQP